MLTQVKDHLTHEYVDSTLKAQLLAAEDSSLIGNAYIVCRKTDDKEAIEAMAKISRPGKYILRLNAEGYLTKDVSFNVPKMYKRERHIELPPTYMRRKPKEKEYDLKEIVVTATKLKFCMKGDTLVYDADAFSLAEGSMIDVLIKKLPGVEMNKNGEIFLNGRKIETLLLNGKDFFDKNREFMLENMPAYLVKNIQSYERTPEDKKGTNQERTAPKELVMDIKLKRDYNQGWVAVAEGGSGVSYKKDYNGDLNDTFLGRFFALNYSDRLKIAAFFNANNMNNERSPGEGGEWSPLSQSQGIIESYTSGMNYSIQKNENSKYNGSLNVSYKERYDSNHTSGETFLDRGNIHDCSFMNSSSYNLALTTNNNITFRKHKSGWYKQVYFNIRPYFCYARWNRNLHSASAAGNVDLPSQLGKAWLDSISTPNSGHILKKYATNHVISTAKDKGNWTDVHIPGTFTWTPPHNDYYDINVEYDYQYIKSSESGFEHYFLNHINSAASDCFQNKYTPTYNQTNRAYIKPRIFFFTDRNHKHGFGIHDAISFNQQKSNRLLYLLDRIEGWGNMGGKAIGTLPSTEEMVHSLDADNSIKSNTRILSNSPRLTYQFFNRNDSVMYYWVAGIGIETRHEQMDYWQGAQADTAVTRVSNLLSISVSYNYMIEKRGRRISAACNMYTVAPPMASMLDVKNTSNPLYITHGNPNLRNTRHYSLESSYQDKFRRTFFNVSLKANMTRDAIASGILYNKQTGVRNMTPDNINGNWSYNIATGVDMPICRTEKLRLKDNLSYEFNRSVDLIGTTDGKDCIPAPRSVVCSRYVNNGLELYLRPNSTMEFSIKGNLHYQNSIGKHKSDISVNVLDFDYGVITQVELPWNLQISTDLTMYSRRGYSDTSINKNELVWNARATKKMLKGNLLLQLDGFDIFRSLSNIRRTINAQGRTETFYNVIPSYCIFHVTWRFKKSPKRRVLNHNT